MIDPLRPYWPTNRSLGGLILRALGVAAPAAAVFAGVSRSVTLLVVACAGLGQASLLVFEWMELRRARKPGLVALGVMGFIFVSLVFVLIVEGRSILVRSVR